MSVSFSGTRRHQLLLRLTTTVIVIVHSCKELHSHLVIPNIDLMRGDLARVTRVLSGRPIHTLEFRLLNIPVRQRRFLHKRPLVDRLLQSLALLVLRRRLQRRLALWHTLLAPCPNDVLRLLLEVLHQCPRPLLLVNLLGFLLVYETLYSRLAIVGKSFPSNHSTQAILTSVVVYRCLVPIVRVHLIVVILERC